MATIKLKEYGWGKYWINQNLAAGIIGILLALAAWIQYSSGNGYLLIFVFFLAISVFGFLQYFFMKKNKICIKISDDEITIFPQFYTGSTKILKWEDITAIDTSKKNIVTFRGLKGNDTKVKLLALNKNDRENFIQVVNDKIKGKEAS